ncbi:prepilin peptidase [Bremerella sp. JC817]|uniref:prepilin peptidase n=1 Tax=Bremerella sp. JC817 TaxID=3231756 RepID=UPI00345B3E61
MNWWENLVDLWVNLSMSVRLILLFLLGTVVGGQLNRAVYRWTWVPKHYDPWSKPLPGAPSRSIFDKVPVFGWLGLARESKLHGTAHWVQPFFVELGCGFFFAWYYHWLVDGELASITINTAMSQGAIHSLFVQHIVLISLMVIATFVDFDSRTIPDLVTVPGFVIGLVLCWLLPFVGLPIPGGPPYFGLAPAGRAIEAVPLDAATLDAWPAWFNGPWGLAIGLFLVVGWWFALSPKIVWTKWGMAKFFRYLIASFVRYAFRWFYLTLLAFLVLFVTAAWLWGGPATWQMVFTSLLGMSFAGMLIWMVRFFASFAMGQEAMGFGDVTLMCMIGAYIGWQPVMVIFFLAPFIACVFAIINYLLTGDAYLAYGPYLCIGTLVTMVFWAKIWQQYGPLLGLGVWLPALFLALPVVLGVMLTAWVWIKFTFIYPEEAK